MVSALYVFIYLWFFRSNIWISTASTDECSAVKTDMWWRIKEETPAENFHREVEKKLLRCSNLPCLQGALFSNISLHSFSDCWVCELLHLPEMDQKWSNWPLREASVQHVRHPDRVCFNGMYSQFMSLLFGSGACARRSMSPPHRSIM